ncbi:MAG TPA: methyltransferase domain-containing protein, partial [Candidatus Eisenbacteria bacterium]|nr:methyltransferase domain-containing protein [Candidatus Eisenbacteria bacterium]
MNGEALEREIPCACGEAAHTPVRPVSGNWGPVRLAECARCGLTRDVTDYPDRNIFYVTDGIYKAPDEETFEAQLKGCERYVNFLERRAGRPGRALEVGCNSGYLLKRLSEKGWSVCGIDLNSAN